MSSVFQVKSISGRTIRLTDTQWFHILAHHVEMQGQLERIRETLAKPDFILYDLREDSYLYYRRYRATPVSRKYLLVIVKHVDSEGFIITGFFVARAKRAKRTWSRR